MEKPRFLQKEPRRNYEYFKDERQRHDIYEFSKGVTSYLHNQKIPNIILLDRSARQLWVGIDEYWKLNYKNEPRPNIYFVNPEGFDTAQKVKDRENITEVDILFDRIEFTTTGDSPLFRKTKEADKEIEEQFLQAYSKLTSQKDKPLAIFDNCIHSGDTMMSVLRHLHKFGYEDLRVVVGETSNDRSTIPINAEFTDKINYVSCGAFGRDYGVSKEDGNIFSELDTLMVIERK